MRNKGVVERAALMFVFVVSCLFQGTSVDAAEGQTSFGLKPSTISVEKGNTFIVTVDGVNLKDLFAYELIFERSSGITFESGTDSLPGGSPASYLENHILRYGSTKFGTAAGENGSRTLARLSFTAKAEGTASLKLVRVKTLDPALHPTIHEVNQTISVRITPDADSGNGNANGNDQGTPRTVTEEDGASQVGSGRIVVSSDGPLQAPLALLQAWVKLNPAAVIELKAGKTSYSLPLSELTSQALRTKFGSDAGQAVINIAIAEADANQKTLANNGAARIGAKLLTDPVEFQVTAVLPGGTSIPISTFAVYVPRSFELDFDVDPARTTGVYLDEATGELLPVPTVFRVVNGIVVADLYRKGNSAYALVQADKRFADLEGHWSRTTVETMANKLLVKGTSAQSFAPDKPVTRAEFAALLARALVLKAAAGQTSFNEIDGKWYEEAVQAASDAGLMKGDPDGNFRPDAWITRQELAAVLKRAAGYAGTPIDRTAPDSVPVAFSDLPSVAAWARADIADVANSGLMEGDSSAAFRPKAPASRAEAAVVLKRLLVRAEMFGE